MTVKRIVKLAWVLFMWSFKLEIGARTDVHVAICQKPLASGYAGKRRITKEHMLSLMLDRPTLASERESTAKQTESEISLSAYSILTSLTSCHTAPKCPSCVGVINI